MVKQVAVLSFTEQGYRFSEKIREALETERVREDDARDGEVGESAGRDCGGKAGNGAEQDGAGLRWEEKNHVVLYRKSRDLKDDCGNAVLVTASLHDWCEDVFSRFSAIVFVGAAGIAVRTIAPFLVSKTEDPAVLVADERGEHIISLLSGHLGGGNALTFRLAAALGADPVITTSSDVNGKLAVDVWAKKNNLYITDLKAAKDVAARIVGGAAVPFYCEGRVVGEIPPEFVRVKCAEKERMVEEEQTVGAVRMGWDGEERLRDRDELQEADPSKRVYAADRISLPAVGDTLVTVSVFEPRRFLPGSDLIFGPDLIFESGEAKASPMSNRDCVILHLVPRATVLGIGCKKGKSMREIRDFVFRILEERKIAPQSIAAVASIDLKSGEEGLLKLAVELGVPFLTFSSEELRAVPGVFRSSEFVSSVTGVDNVCERAAMAALTEEEQKKARFLCRKTAGCGVTAALLEREWEVTF